MSSFQPVVSRGLLVLLMSAVVVVLAWAMHIWLAPAVVFLP